MPSSSPAVTPLVSPQWLATRLDDSALLIVDIRSAVDGGGRAAFEAAHIPGAVHTDYAKDGWRATQGSATGLLPETDALSTLLGRLGLTPAHHAVIVPAGVSPGDFNAAARVYWTLKVAGHVRMSILNGGMRAWSSDPERPVEIGAGRGLVPGDCYPVKLVPELRAELAAVQDAIERSSATLLDSRNAASFEGHEKSPQAARAGRLPGAQHLDHSKAYDREAQALKAQIELEALFAPVPPGASIHYCNTGHQAATNWFVASEILGREAALYDGSMSQWTEDANRPVETGR